MNEFFIQESFAQNVLKYTRAVLTDPHVHQKLHDQHAKKWGRYIGWWYQADIWGLIDSQVKYNSL